MRVLSTFWLPAVLLTAAAPAHAAPPAPAPDAACTAFMTLVKQTYTFRPSKLSDAERSQKSAAMDQVWEVAKKDRGHIVPCLKAALVDPAAPTWFLVDGSSLLLQLDYTRPSKEIYVRNWSHADLEDVQSRRWVESLSTFAAEGFDVTAAAQNLVAHPFRSYNLPSHSIMIDGKGAAFFLFASMDEAQARPILLKAIANPQSPVRTSAVGMLIAQASPESVRELKKLDLQSLPKATQDEVKAYLANKTPPLQPSKTPAFTRPVFTAALQKSLTGDAKGSAEFSALLKRDSWAQDAAAVLTIQDLPALRQARRYLVSHANPHVMEQYRRFTAVIETVDQKALASAR